MDETLFEDTFFSCVAGVDDCPLLADCLLEYPVFNEQAETWQAFSLIEEVSTAAVRCDEAGASAAFLFNQQQSDVMKQVLQLRPTI